MSQPFVQLPVAGVGVGWRVRRGSEKQLCGLGTAWFPRQVLPAFLSHLCSLAASLTTEPPIQPRLGELAAVEVTPSAVHLSWTVAQGPFDSFLVQYRDAQGQPQMVPVSGDLSEVTVSGLEPSRKYKFLLFGLLGGKRHGPVSTEAKTGE